MGRGEQSGAPRGRRVLLAETTTGTTAMTGHPGDGDDAGNGNAVSPMGATSNGNVNNGNAVRTLSNARVRGADAKFE